MREGLKHNRALECEDWERQLGPARRDTPKITINLYDAAT
jgi:hypothetical protein